MSGRAPERGAAEILRVWELAEGPAGATGPFARVAVPGAWPAGGADVRTYRTMLPPCPLESGERLHLELEACAVGARVLLGDREVGRHRGDWVPWSVELPPEEASAGASLLVEVEALPDHPTRGFLPACDLVHAGLWRPVGLRRTGPVRLDRRRLRILPREDGVQVEAPVDGPAGWRLAVRVREAAGRLLGEASAAGTQVHVPVSGLAPWSPEEPRLHRLELDLLDASGRLSDTEMRTFGRRTLRARGRSLLLNGRPLLLRGILHWGCYPEVGAPDPEPAALEAELTRWKSLGFNSVKCCLFIPPRRFLEMCDRLGILVWQEYPLWLKPLEGEGLVREYEDFFFKDQAHPCVVVRSLTCENDAVDPGTRSRIMDIARRVLPGELLLDNSAWLALEGDGDFYDEHPYLHNAQWPWYLARTARTLGQLPERPLLLGETMAADTPPLAEDLRRAGTQDSLRYASAYRELLDSRRRSMGEDPDLEARARRMAGAVRQHQAELLRIALPGTGFVVNTARDIPSCPLGLDGIRGTEKLSVQDLAWQGDTALIPELPRRSFLAGETARVPVHLSHFGRSGLAAGPMRWRFDGAEGEVRCDAVGCGTTPQVAELELDMPEVTAPEPRLLELQHGDLQVAVRLWVVPPASHPVGMQVLDSLGEEARRHLQAGGLGVHPASRPRAGSWRAPENVFWSLIPRLAPDHLSPEVPHDLLEDLLPLDLLSGRVLQAPPAGGARTLLELWDLHGTPAKAQGHPLVLAARVGRGRLLVSALEHHDTPAGRWLLAALGHRLPEMDLPEASCPLPPSQATVMLGGPWRLEPGSREVVTGTPRLNRGANVFEGWATFSGTVAIPASWTGRRILLRAEAVGDAYRMETEEVELAAAGDETGVLHGVRDEPRTFDVTGRLVPGRRHALRISVRDWRGGGGMVGPVYLTTGDPESGLLY